MKNVIFISPNFPTNYWQFCRELKNNGLNVLGIGDQPYDQLSGELKDSLNAYGSFCHCPPDGTGRWECPPPDRTPSYGIYI